MPPFGRQRFSQRPTCQRRHSHVRPPLAPPSLYALQPYLGLQVHHDPIDNLRLDRGLSAIVRPLP